MDYKNKQLTDVIEYSETMLKEAEAGNWETVFTVEKQRSQTLKEIFSPPFTKKDKNKNNGKILQILKINNKLEKITSKARDDIRHHVGSVNKSHNIVAMYAQNAG